MNIGIQVDKNDFLYDIHSLVKSFFPEDEVSIYTDGDTEKCEAVRDLCIRVEIPEYTNRKDAKDSLKRSIYEMLSDLTGQQLPWGTLSGIRPTKIPMKMMEEGKSSEEIRSYLRDNYYTSDEKITLAETVARNERALIAPLGLTEDSYSLYQNIPFCPSICLYCTFSSSPVSAWKKQVDTYLETLVREMERDLSESGIRRDPTTWYIGGGTPTSVSAEQLDYLLTETKKLYDFSNLREFTVEAGRPDSITEEKLAVLKKHKVTRISVNPQTMNQETLDFIGRHHTVEDTERAFRMARDAGFDNINMDMILGLPGEGEREIRHTLDAIRDMNPDSLTVHSLAVKRASRLTREIREDRMADAAADYGSFGGRAFENDQHIMDLASQTAYDLGMEPYYLYRQKNMKGNLENTGFARPGKACLYNILIMEELQSIRAYGSGASTKFVTADGKITRQINPKDVKTYLERNGASC